MLAKADLLVKINPPKLLRFALRREMAVKASAVNIFDIHIELNHHVPYENQQRIIIKVNKSTNIKNSHSGTP